MLMKTGILYIRPVFTALVPFCGPFCKDATQMWIPYTLSTGRLEYILPSLHQYPSDLVKRLVLCTGVKSTAPQACTREKTCDHQLNYNYDTVALTMITR